MHRAPTVLAVSLLAASLVGLGCRTAAPGAGDEGPVVARIGDEEVTVAELDAYIKDDLFERETRGGNPARTHDLRSQALEQMVREKAIELEAKRRGLSDEALLEAEFAKQAPVSDADVAAFYEQNRAQLQGATLEQVAPRIRGHLENERRRAAVEALVASADVEVTLERPRVEVSSAGPSKGPADAPVTIIEFSDFQCPYCQRALPLLEAVTAKYPEQVRVVYRHLPLDSIHPQARAGAEASACAAEKGRFWEYHDLLFQNPRAMGDEDLRRYAAEVGLEAEAFDECLRTRRHAAAIDADVRDATAAGITGTPAFVVNGIVLFGLQSEEALDALIREELARVEGGGAEPGA